MIHQLFSAFRTLTIIPIPGKDTQNLSRSLPFFPVIGLFLGAIVYGLIKASEIAGIGQSIIVATILLIVVTVLTGALHIDGLGDVADGFGSRKKKEDVLAIFKDSRLGTFGVCAVVFDLLLKVFCFNELITTEKYLIIVISLITGRCMQSIFLCFIPLARENSSISPFVKSTILIKISVLCVSALFITLSGYFIGYFNAFIYFASAFIASLVFVGICMKKIGGITGDCVGAINELSEIAVLLCGVIYN